MAAGFFSEISAPEIRSAVAQYYSILSFAQGQLDHFRQNGAVPFDAAGEGLLLAYDANARTRARMVFDFDALAKNSRFVSELVGALRNQRIFQTFRHRVLASAEAMCAAPGQAAGKACPPADEAAS